MEILIGWIIFSIIAAIIASSKGRSGGGYFVLSLVLSPLIGIILAAALPSLKPQSAGGSGATPTPATHVKCPDCRELVLADARKCKHCGCTLVPESDMTEDQIMAHYGFRKEGRIYHVGDLRFDDLGKAVSAARKAS